MAKPKVADEEVEEPTAYVQQNRVVRFNRDYVDLKIAGLNFKAGDIIVMDPISVESVLMKDQFAITVAPLGVTLEEALADQAAEGKALKQAAAIPVGTVSAE